MIGAVSDNTRAVLLLTAPLLLGRGDEGPRTVTATEYRRLVQLLIERQARPADLVAGSDELLEACGEIVDRARLEALLARGLRLAQALEQWQARGIWVLGRGDRGYPRRLLQRQRTAAPALLYGCGDVGILDHCDLAVVGSRRADAETLAFARRIGADCAEHGHPVVSGGARGVDAAAMQGALDAGGLVVGVLADGLERAAVAAAYRPRLQAGQLALLAGTDPKATFHVGAAMQRNRWIYCLARAGLVVECDHGKGGTWAGASAQLDKHREIPVFVRADDRPSAGRAALLEFGARPWPAPKAAAEWKQVFRTPAQQSPSKGPPSDSPGDDGDERS